MRLEKEGGGFEPVSGPTHLAAVCEQGSTVGVCVCDSPTGTFTLAQFEDDVQRTRLRTLLAALPPAEVLVPRGSRDLAEICERATGASVELLTPQSEFLDADSCIEYLTICGAFPKASKQGNDTDVSARWPPVLRTAVGDEPIPLSAHWAPWPGGCDGPWWTSSYSACAASTPTCRRTSGKLLNQLVNSCPTTRPSYSKRRSPSPVQMTTTTGARL